MSVYKVPKPKSLQITIGDDYAVDLVLASSPGTGAYTARFEDCDGNRQDFVAVESAGPTIRLTMSDDITLSLGEGDGTWSLKFTDGTSGLERTICAGTGTATSYPTSE